MNFEHYTEFVVSGMDLSKNGDTPRERLMLAGMGLGGEAGEVCDHAKKVAFHGKPMDRDALLAELGDVLWYFALMLHTNNLTLEQVMARNVYKICDRYPDRHGDPLDIFAGIAV